MLLTQRELILTMRPELHYNDGPCVQELDRTLKQIGVERQAYFGGTFVGNHVNKCLKVIHIMHILKII